ncbi:hypothetical protein CDC46_26220, partial [Ralstonia solanacearum]
ITPLDAPQEFAIEARREKRDRDGTQDTPLMRALGLAHYWQRLLDELRFASVAEIARAEGIDASRVYRLLRLTLLAPKVVEQLIGTPGIALEPVMRRTWSAGWDIQIKVMASMR